MEAISSTASLNYSQISLWVEESCATLFDRLPKKGKPQPHEWTLLAGLCATRRRRQAPITSWRLLECVECAKEADYAGVSWKERPPVGGASAWHAVCPHVELRVLCLSTGTKCVGRTQQCSQGTRVHDAHAEILVKRLFQRLLWSDIDRLESVEKDHSSEGGKAANQEEKHDSCVQQCPLLDYEPGVPWRIAADYQFHFYTSEPPCGDGSIFDIGEQHGLVSEEGPKRGLENPVQPAAKLPRLDRPSRVDIHRTGAKPVEGEPPDPLLPGVSYHATHSLRFKPGRGDRSMLMACSDKIALWLVLGIQGALLTRFIEPIHLSSFTVGEPRAIHSTTRALRGRWEDAVGPSDTEEKPLRFPSALPILPGTPGRFRHGEASVTALGPLSSVAPLSPPACSAAVCWGADAAEAEIILGTTGHIFGWTQKGRRKLGSHVPVGKEGRYCSSLCRRRMLGRAVALLAQQKRFEVEGHKGKEGAVDLSLVPYASLKATASAYQESKQHVLARGRWKHYVRQPGSLVQFSVESVVTV